MTRSGTPPDDGELDVAIVGAGAAGTYVAYRLIQARPDWRIAVFERSNRIGGRLWSEVIVGLVHPIELGGMRYMTGHVRVHWVVTELGIETRHFDPAHRPERLFLRGIVGESPDDPNAGSAYDLPAGEAGRSATDLMRGAFLKIVPLARELDEVGWRQLRSTATLGGRRVTDWSINEAVATILSAEGHRFATDAFGYDSGINPHNAGDAIQYMLGTGYPSGEARVPVGGMDRIPRELAARFEAGGGMMRLGHDLRRVETSEGSILLGFAAARASGRGGSSSPCRSRPSRRSPAPHRSSTGRPGGGRARTCAERSSAVATCARPSGGFWPPRSRAGRPRRSNARSGGCCDRTLG